MRLVTPFTGTVRRDKRFLPQKFSAKKELGLYQSAFGFQEHRMLCSYQGHRSKNVILVSSMHNEAALDPSNEKRKPEVVLFYNETKGGVDSMDKMALSYTTKRSTKRWPLVLFCNLLDLSTIAARVVYQEKHPNEKLGQKTLEVTLFARWPKVWCGTKLSGEVRHWWEHPTPSRSSLKKL